MYFPVSTPSHKNVFRPLAHALAERDHQVTLVSGIKDEYLPLGVNEIYVENATDFLTTMSQLAGDQNSSNVQRWV